MKMVNGQDVEGGIDLDARQDISDLSARVGDIEDGITVTSISQESFTATEGQTLFTLTTFTYTAEVNQLEVYLDGVRSFDFTETSTSSFTMGAGVPVGVDVTAVKLNLVTGVGTGTVTEVTSANTDLTVATGTSTPALTVNRAPTVKDQNTSTGVTNIKLWTGTQAEYDAIGSKDAATLYFIKEA